MGPPIFSRDSGQANGFLQSVFPRSGWRQWGDKNEAMVGGGEEHDGWREIVCAPSCRVVSCRGEGTSRVPNQTQQAQGQHGCIGCWKQFIIPLFSHPLIRDPNVYKVLLQTLQVLTLVQSGSSHLDIFKFGPQSLPLTPSLPHHNHASTWSQRESGLTVQPIRRISRTTKCRTTPL